MLDYLEDCAEAVVDELIEVVGLSKGGTDISDFIKGVFRYSDGDCLTLGQKFQTKLRGLYCNASFFGFLFLFNF